MNISIDDLKMEIADMHIQIMALNRLVRAKNAEIEQLKASQTVEEKPKEGNNA